MVCRAAILALALGIGAAVAPQAQAYVIYKLDNPARNFTLLIYHSPGFITTDTVVPVADLFYFAPPPLNFISSVEFIPSSSNASHPGLPEVDVFQYSGGPPQSFTGNQYRWYPEGTFTHYGVTKGIDGPGLDQSFGFPNSQLVVAAPEPSTIGSVTAGLFGLLAWWRRSARP
jgi:hypothetical protein